MRSDWEMLERQRDLNRQINEDMSYQITQDIARNFDANPLGNIRNDVRDTMNNLGQAFKGWWD